MPDRSILFLNTQSFGQPGGIANFNRHLLNAISETENSLSLTNISLLKPEEKVDVLKIVKLFRYIRFMITTLLHSKKKVDLILCGHINLIWISILLSLIYNKKIIMIMHGVDVWYLNPRRAKTINQFIDSYISVSQYTVSRFQKVLGKKVTFELIYNCVDLNEFYPKPKCKLLLEQYNLTLKNKVISFLGRLDANESYKGVDELIQVLPAVLETDRDAVLVIGGVGTDRRRLENKVKKLNLQHAVRFVGYVQDKDLVDFYSIADCFAMPGYGEGFGIVYLEASACGIPVIGSTRDGSAEALLQGELGVLVDPANSAELKYAIINSIAKQKKQNANITFYSKDNFYKRAITILGNDFN